MKVEGKNSMIFGVVGGLLLVGLIFLSFYLSYQKRIDIKENEVTSIGKVIRDYRQKSRGYFIVYEYRYKEIKYQSHQQSSKGDYMVGDCYLVKLSHLNPEHSEIQLNSPKECE